MGADNGSVGAQAAEESVSFVNSKNLGDQPAFYVGLAFKGAVDLSSAFGASLVALSARASKYLLSEDPNEALATQKLFSDGVASQISQLGASIASLQQDIKGAQTTPPVSSPAPVVAPK